MTTSVFVTNLVWVLLFANWLAEWNWREKFAGFKENRLLHAVLAMAAVHLLWMAGTENLLYGLYDLQKKLPLLGIPLVVLTTRPLTRRESQTVGFCYLGTVLTVSVIGLVRYLTIEDLPYRDIIPYISHIRFGLHICFSVILLAYMTLKSGTVEIFPRVSRRLLRIVAATAGLWLTAYLLLMHAYTGIIILLVLCLVLPIAYRHRIDRKIRRATLAVGITLWLTAGLATAYYHHEYYTLQPLSIQPTVAVTANGNPYTHGDDGMVENGNYVSRYICEQELRSEWSKRSDYPIDSLTPVGYPVYPALVRYLNALGTTKDSAGMALLQPADVQAIEQGIANPVYNQKGARKLFYVLFYEHENYRCFHRVRDFSTLQRIELWKHGWQVFRAHPLFGVGTGDGVDSLQQSLRESDSPLADSGMHLHNQFLTFLVAFGLVGFLLIAFAFILAVVKSRSCRSILFTAWMCITLLSFLSDDTMETLAGITFVALGYSLLANRNENDNDNQNQNDNENQNENGISHS